MAKRRPIKYVVRAEVLKQCLAVRRLSVDDLARRACVGRNTLYGMIQGKAVTFAVIETIAMTLGLDIEDLLQPLPEQLTVSIQPSPKGEFHLALSLSGTFRGTDQATAIGTLAQQFVDRLRDRDIHISKQQSTVILKDHSDGFRRHVVRLVEYVNSGDPRDPGWAITAWYAAIRPSCYSKLTTGAHWNLDGDTVNEYGELIKWGDRRLDFNKPDSVLEIIIGPPTPAKHHENFMGLRCFEAREDGWFDVESEKGNPLLFDLSTPEGRTEFLLAIRNDVYDFGANSGIFERPSA